MRGRSGFTLAELLVGMVIFGVVGVALTKLFVSQSRFLSWNSLAGIGSSRSRVISFTISVSAGSVTSVRTLVDASQ